MEVGKKVKVSNRNQINYPLKGEVIQEEIAPGGLAMSKVKFVTAEVWYADSDLKELKK